MKRALSLFIVSIALSLAACGQSSAPASDKALTCAKKAVEIAESYLAYDIEYDEASERLKELREDMEYVSDMSKEDENYSGDFAISCDLLTLSSAITTDNYKNSAESYEKVQEMIENMKEYIE